MHTNKNETNFSISNLKNSVFATSLVAFSMVVALLTYGYEITDFSLSIDEELHSFNSRSWLTWISQGRWGMGVLTYIFPDQFSTIPFLPTFMFAIGLATSAVILSKIFTNSREGAVVFTGVFVSSPIWLHIGEFNTLSWGLSVGLVVTAVAIRLINIGGSKSGVIAGICVGFSLAIYQALFILFLTFTLLLCIKNEFCLAENRKSTFFHRNTLLFVDLFKSITIALAVYFFMNQVFMYLSGSSLSYLNNFVNFSVYTSNDAGVAIKKVIHQTKGLIIGTDPTFLGLGATSLILFWIGIAFAVKTLLYSRVSIITKTYISALSMGILLLAVLLIIISAGTIPTRALIVFPVLYATLSAFLFQYKNFQKLLWIMFGGMLFANIYIANSLFYADQVARQRDLLMATRLIDKIEDVGRGVFGEKIPLVIVGNWQHELGGPALRVEIFGDSFFEHDGGNSYRVAAYLRLLGCKGLTPLPITEVQNELSNIDLHPSWPAKGSVFKGKNAVVVKLSAPSYQQLLILPSP